jgi:hypothetical protein
VGQAAQGAESQPCRDLCPRGSRSSPETGIGFFGSANGDEWFGGYVERASTVNGWEATKMGRDEVQGGARYFWSDVLMGAGATPRHVHNPWLVKRALSEPCLRQPPNNPTTNPPPPSPYPTLSPTIFTRSTSVLHQGLPPHQPRRGIFLPAPICSLSQSLLKPLRSTPAIASHIIQRLIQWPGGVISTAGAQDGFQSRRYHSVFSHSERPIRGYKDPLQTRNIQPEC